MVSLMVGVRVAGRRLQSATRGVPRCRTGHFRPTETAASSVERRGSLATTPSPPWGVQRIEIEVAPDILGSRAAGFLHEGMGGEMVRYAGASPVLPPFTAPVG